MQKKKKLLKSSLNEVNLINFFQKSLFWPKKLIADSQLIYNKMPEIPINKSFENVILYCFLR